MTPKDYEREFDRLAVDNPIVHGALTAHEQARSKVDLVLAMKVMVVELARHNAILTATVESLFQNSSTLIRLCDHEEACPNESKTETTTYSGS